MPFPPETQAPIVSTVTIFSFFPAFFLFVFAATASIVWTVADRAACSDALIAFYLGCIVLVSTRHLPSAFPRLSFSLSLPPSLSSPFHFDFPPSVVSNLHFCGDE